MKKKIRILSLDGGGIRGIMTCVILDFIEKEIQKTEGEHAKLGEYFDLIAGTSTGGLITALLLYPDENGNAKFSVDAALKLYTDQGDDIFDVRIWDKLGSVFGLLDEKIDKKQIENELHRIFGDLELKEFIRPCLITAYDVYARSAKFFTSHEAHNPLENFLVRDVCRATSAAPTYFEPARIYSKYDQEFTLIDGGVFANNPTLCAFVEARKIPFSIALDDLEKPNFPNLEDIVCISVGTGEVKQAYTFDQLKRGGKIKWIQPLIDILLSSNSETVSYQMQKLYESLGESYSKNYYRLMPNMGTANPEMDDASPKNMQALIQSAKNFVQQNQKTLSLIAKELIANK